MSEYFSVEARLKLVRGWRRARKMEGVRNVLKVSELDHGIKERAFQVRLHGKYKCGEVGRWRGSGKSSEM